MSNNLESQSSSEQKFHLDFKRMLITNAVLTLVLIKYLFEDSEAIEKVQVINFDKTMDLMLGIEENSL